MLSENKSIGVKRFSVHRAGARNYIYEWIFHQGRDIALYWNSISAINPSTSGLHYKHEGLIHSRLGRHDVLNSTFGLLGIYNTHFNQHGAGVTISR